MKTNYYKEFYKACEIGAIQPIQEMLLLELDFNALDTEDTYGKTSFFIACQNNHKKIVELLLKDGRIDLNKKNNDGLTPFSLACKSGHKEIVELLLKDCRIDVNETDILGISPFSFACQRGHEQIVELLLKDRRIDVKKTDNYGKSPFYLACEKGFQEVVEILLKDRRVDLKKTDTYGNTPFSIACKKGYEEVIKLLVQDPRIDLIGTLESTTLTDTCYNKLSKSLCSVAGKIILSSSQQDILTIDLASKICAMIKNVNAILNQNIQKEFNVQIHIARNKIVNFAGEQQIKDLKAKLSIWEPIFSFTMMVFLSDGYVTIKPDAPDEIKRFFEIAQQLPMEIQMKIAQRMVTDEQDSTILSTQVEWASKYLFLLFEDGVEAIGYAS